MTATGIFKAKENNTVPEEATLKDTLKLGAIAKRMDPDDGKESSASDQAEIRWERYASRHPDIPVRVERLSGMFPWTYMVAFENEGVEERWLLRGFAPATKPPE